MAAQAGCRARRWASCQQSSGADSKGVAESVHAGEQGVTVVKGSGTIDWCAGACRPGLWCRSAQPPWPASGSRLACEQVQRAGAPAASTCGNSLRWAPSQNLPASLLRSTCSRSSSRGMGEGLRLHPWPPQACCPCAAGSAVLRAVHAPTDLGQAAPPHQQLLDVDPLEVELASLHAQRAQQAVAQAACHWGRTRALGCRRCRQGRVQRVSGWGWGVGGWGWGRSGVLPVLKERWRTPSVRGRRRNGTVRGLEPTGQCCLLGALCLRPVIGAAFFAPFCPSPRLAPS